MQVGGQVGTDGKGKRRVMPQLEMGGGEEGGWVKGCEDCRGEEQGDNQGFVVGVVSIREVVVVIQVVVELAEVVGKDLGT